MTDNVLGVSVNTEHRIKELVQGGFTLEEAVDIAKKERVKSELQEAIAKDALEQWRNA